MAWLGAVQAQDYLGALWAVGLRMKNTTEADVERALADRTIVRTWPMRGTLHFVAAADVRWMLELMTPRVVAASARRLQQELDLNDTVFAHSRDVLVKALRGGRQRSRTAMYEALEAAGIPATGQRGLHILWRLAQDGVLCFGAREGKQQTFVLLDEWVPNARRLDRDEALAELARRYFTSHGPATVQDFTWWSGLAPAAATAALDLAKPGLVREDIEGRAYWLSASMPTAKAASSAAYLLPAYDEYTVSYKDRSAVLDPLHAKRPDSGNGIFNPTMVLDGRVVGTWKRTLKKESVVVVLRPFSRLKKTEKNAFQEAGCRYGAFLGRPAVLD
ncbi:MAG TPA: winged helix DNA-binding domain-containing protein [Thermoanaerobaculia bacterium]|nr:winged helix DNA-binding domain-containing protein [Thermoanaerobaculia bacterium]